MTHLGLLFVLFFGTTAGDLRFTICVHSVQEHVYSNGTVAFDPFRTPYILVALGLAETGRRAGVNM